MHRIARRTVFLVGGYERKTADAFFARLKSQAGIFCKTWDVTYEQGPVAKDPDRNAASAEVRSALADTSVATRFVLFDLDDMVTRDNNRPFSIRLWRYILAFADYLVTGTGFRLFAANWRFGGYFLFPAMALAGFFIAGLLVARFVSGFEFAFSQQVGAVLGVAMIYLLGRAFGRRYFVFHLMDLWSFSREFLRGKRPDMDARIDDWATMIANEHAANEADEILLLGHSTGGGIILQVAARAASLIVEQGRGEPAFAVLTLGSTALKFGLHPAATRFRSEVEALSRHGQVRWTDYQALIDIINFYRIDPFARMGLTHVRKGAFPRVLRVRIRQMLDRAYYRQIRHNFFPHPLPVHFRQFAALFPRSLCRVFWRRAV